MIQSGFIDRWSLPHTLVGAAYSILGINARTALIMSVSWEVVEMAHLIPSYDWHEESIVNQIGDVFCNMVGYYAIECMRNMR